MAALRLLQLGVTGPALHPWLTYGGGVQTSGAAVIWGVHMEEFCGTERESK